MASWFPLEVLPRQWVDSSDNTVLNGYWLIAFQAGTTTLTNMAEDDTGSGQALKFEVNSNGYLVNSGSTVINPHVDQAVKLGLVPTEAEADAGDTTNSIWPTVGSVKPLITTAGQEIWTLFSGTPTRTSNTTFTLTGDQTTTFTVGSRLKLGDASTLYGTITTSVYTSLTTVTVVLDSGNLSASLSQVFTSIAKTDEKPISSHSVSHNSLSTGFVNRTLSEYFSDLPLSAIHAGFVGDDSTDNSTAWDNMITAATATGKTEVYFPNGIYQIGSAKVLQTTLSIVGQDKLDTQLKWVGLASGVWGFQFGTFDSRFDYKAMRNISITSNENALMIADNFQGKADVRDVEVISAKEAIVLCNNQDLTLLNIRTDVNEVGMTTDSTVTRTGGSGGANTNLTFINFVSQNNTVDGIELDDGNNLNFIGGVCQGDPSGNLFRNDACTLCYVNGMYIEDTNPGQDMVTNNAAETIIDAVHFTSIGARIAANNTSKVIVKNLTDFQGAVNANDTSTVHIDDPDISITRASGATIYRPSREILTEYDAADYSISGGLTVIRETIATSSNFRISFGADASANNTKSFMGHFSAYLGTSAICTFTVYAHGSGIISTNEEVGTLAGVSLTITQGFTASSPTNELYVDFANGSGSDEIKLLGYYHTTVA